MTLTGSLATQAHADGAGTRTLRRQRWWFAAGAFALGAVYTTLVASLGVEFRLGSRDVTLAVALATELAFAGFGFLLGRAAESRTAERRAAEAERAGLERLAALQTRLAQAEKLAAVGQLASAIAHEVRNPLAIVRSLVQNLAEAPRPEGEPRRTCALVIEEIDRLTRVTASLVGLARPVRPRLAELAARDIVDRVVWLGRRLLEDRSLRVQDGPSGARVRADPDLACQVLLGLVGNAAEASGAGEPIDLEWREGEREVAFRVGDRGPGVPAELRERVFEPFFTTKPGGSGLGLAVARQLAEAQGGRLELEPGTERGAAFVLRLPRAEPATARRATGSAAPP